MDCCQPFTRRRDAAATRGAILDAALIRFAAESYDDVGMRDIARDVGVDAALVSRYFGSKEDLFVAVLDGCDNGKGLMNGDRATWGQRVARELVYERKPESKLRGMLIMLRSISSAKASELVQRSADERFHAPFAEWVGEPDGAVRARLAAGMIMGIAIGRELSGGFNMTPEQCELMCARLAVTLQVFIDG